MPSKNCYGFSIHGQRHQDTLKAIQEWETNRENISEKICTAIEELRRKEREREELLKNFGRR